VVNCDQSKLKFYMLWMKRFIYGQSLLCEMPMVKFLVDLTVNDVCVSTLLKNHTSCNMKKVFVVESKLF